MTFVHFESGPSYLVELTEVEKELPEVELLDEAEPRFLSPWWRNDMTTKQLVNVVQMNYRPASA